MTAPALPCTDGSRRPQGDCVGTFRLCLNPGYVFDASWQLRTKTVGLPPSQWPPENWPDGMTARLVFSWGTGTALIIPSVSVVDSWLRFHLTEDETEQVPRDFSVVLELNYGDGWRPWLEGGGCG